MDKAKLLTRNEKTKSSRSRTGTTTPAVTAKSRESHLFSDNSFHPRAWNSIQTTSNMSSDMCSPRYLPGIDERFYQHREVQRSHSTRSSNSRERPRRELQRNRPLTFHSRAKLPTVSVEIAPAPADLMAPEPRRRGSRVERPMEMLNIQPGGSRSVSPRNPRRDSMMSVLNRIWKSDECTRKPGMLKMAALDVPLSGEALSRQLSVSETLVSPTPVARNPLLTLSPKQRKLLKISFSQMNSGGTFLKIMEQVFRRLEAKCPDIRSIFLTTAFVNSLSRERSSPPLVKTEHDHCKCLVEMFEKIMICLDDVDSQLPLFRKYGEKHAQMRESGFTGAMIEHFGEIAVAVIGSQDCVKYNQDAVKSWRVLLAFVTDEMKVGFDRHTKISERRNSSQHSQHSSHGECPYRS